MHFDTIYQTAFNSTYSLSLDQPLTCLQLQPTSASVQYHCYGLKYVTLFSIKACYLVACVFPNQLNFPPFYRNKMSVHQENHHNTNISI